MYLNNFLKENELLLGVAKLEKSDRLFIEDMFQISIIDEDHDNKDDDEFFNRACKTNYYNNISDCLNEIVNKLNKTQKITTQNKEIIISPKEITYTEALVLELQITYML